ncbi:MAG: protein kinase [Planctomycetota bacterium JB042]
MTSADGAEVEAVFQRARRLEGDERARFLDDACAGRDDLRRVVLELLAAHDAPDDPFERKALGDAFSLAAEVGDPGTVGRYRLLRRLGEGGMGVVHLAEQDRPRRVVALKLIRPGFASERSLKRFELEAEALAKLGHEGIARVFDAGVADGVPFLAMERVEGRTLLRYAEEERIDLRARLLLFGRICDAVEHAHRRGVVHRDLKPSNILVEAGGNPRILDFGVARFLDDDDARATTMRTGAGELIGTIQYMSPEQANGDPEPIDGRADVYALGVVLFELLTGRLPYDLRGLAIPDAARVVRENDPTVPSTVDPTLRGDLDTIVGKALEKEKERRYPSAAALAADVRSFLADRPIAAHPPSAAYQLRKLARRHRALVASGLAVFAALTAGLLATAWQWREAVDAREQAERRFEDVRGLARAFIFDIAERIDALPGALEARRALIATGLEYLDRLAREEDPDEGLLLELVVGYTRIGDLQGAAGEPNLRDLVGARRSYETALALADRLARRFPEDSRRQSDRIRLVLSLADVSRELGRPEEGLARCLEARRDAERLVTDHTGDLMIVRTLGNVESRIGSMLLEIGRPAEALPHFEAALASSTRRLAAAPDDAGVRRDVATDTFKRMIVEDALGRTDEALASAREYVRLCRAARDARDGPVERRDLGIGLTRLGDMFVALDRPDDAVGPLTEAVAWAEVRIADEPSDAQARLELNTARNRLGELALARGDLDAAAEAFDECLAITTALCADSEVPGIRRRHGVSLYKLGELARARAARSVDDASRASHLAEARRRFEGCLAVFERMAAEGMLAATDAEVPAEVRREIEALGRGETD